MRREAQRLARRQFSTRARISNLHERPARRSSYLPGEYLFGKRMPSN
jgi:hypothetical protein